MRGAGRALLVSVGFVVCAGFVPVGACTRGCSAGCRSGARVSGRAAVSHVDDLARVVPRAAPRGVVLGGAPARLGGGLGHAAAGLGPLDDAVRALPEVEGSVSAMAQTASRRGAVLEADSATRTFGRDYGRAIDQLGLSKQQHVDLLDVFDLIQNAVELDGDDTDPGTALLDQRLTEILDAEQRDRFVSLLGSPALVVYRIARERPIQRSPAIAPQIP